MIFAALRQNSQHSGRVTTILILVVGLLTACFSSPQPQSASIRLRFACRQADLAQFTALAEQFHSEHPDISITVTSWPDTLLQAPADQASLQAAVRQLATQADAFMWFSPATEVGHLGLLKDLTPFLGAEKQSEKTRYYSALAEQFHAQGASWGLPAGLDPFVLIYDPATFATAGIPQPARDWSWEDLLTAAQKLTRQQANGTVQYGFSDYELDAVVSVVTAKDDLTGKGESELSALRWFADLALRHDVMPNPAGQQLFNPVTMARTGEAALVVSPASLWLQAPPADRRTLRIAPLPALSSAQVYGYFISAGTTKSQAAYQWIHFLGDKAPSRDLMPARTLLLKTWASSVGLDEEAQNALDAAAQHLLEPPLSSEREAGLKKAVTLILEGKDAASALDVLQQTQRSLPPLATVEPFVVPDAPNAQTTQIIFVALYDTEPYAVLAEAFGRENPELSVKVINAFDIGYDGGLPAEMLASSKADCFVGFSPQPTQIDAFRGSVLHIEALTEADQTFPFTDYFPPGLAAISFEDGLWGIPAGVQPPVLWYNRSLFDREKIPYPSADWTWDDSLRTARQLAMPREGGQPYGFLLNPGFPTVSLLEELIGTPRLDMTMTPPRVRFNDSASKEAALQLRELVRADVVPKRKPGSDANFGFFDLVRGNRLAMWQGSAMDMPHQSGSPIQPALLPRGLESAVCYHYADRPTIAYYISAHTEQVQASWKWLRFLVDQLPSTNYLPPRRSLIASETFRAQVGPEAQAVYLAAADCRTSPIGNNLEAALPHAWRAKIWLAQALDAVIWQDADADIELAAAQHKAETYLVCYQVCPDPADAKCAHRCMIQTDPETEKLFATP